MCSEVPFRDLCVLTKGDIRAPEREPEISLRFPALSAKTAVAGATFNNILNDELIDLTLTA